MKTLKNPIHYCNQRTKNLEHPCKYYSQNNLKSKHIKNLKFLKFTHTFSFCLFCSPPLSLSSCSLLLSFFLYTGSTFKSVVGGLCFLRSDQWSVSTLCSLGIDYMTFPLLCTLKIQNPNGAVVYWFCRGRLIVLSNKTWLWVD